MPSQTVTVGSRVGLHARPAALIAGTIVGGLAVTIAQSIGRPKAEAVPEDAVDMAHAHNAAAPVTQPARA